MTDRVALAIARTSEAQAINALLNLAYRGERGWTTEANLVDGERSTVSDVVLLIESSVFLIHKNKNELVACICLQSNGSEVYIGSFAVHPNHQADGLGRAVLSAAEKYAAYELEATQLIMLVLSARDELIAFYERRGYRRTGIVQAYPLHLNVGIPRRSDLTVEQLRKSI